MSSAAPWFVTAPEPITTEPTRTCSWIEPAVPMRMIVRMPACTSSLTTMLIDGAPIPLVAHTTGAPPGSRATKASSPRLRASSAPPARRDDRDQLGTPRVAAEQGDRRAVGQVLAAEPDVVQTPLGHGR